MCCTYKEDGIYQIRLTEDNPLAEYLLVKTYGDIHKERRMSEIKDCLQQVEEWDEEFFDKYREFTGRRTPIIGEEPKRPAMNSYALYTKTGELVDQGSAKELADKYNKSMKNLSNAAREKRPIICWINDRRIRYLVKKVNPVLAY